jgi:hypothetical protein
MLFDETSDLRLQDNQSRIRIKCTGRLEPYYFADEKAGTRP